LRHDRSCNYANHAGWAIAGEFPERVPALCFRHDTDLCRLAQQVLFQKNVCRHIVCKQSRSVAATRIERPHASLHARLRCRARKRRRLRALRGAATGAAAGHASAPALVLLRALLVAHRPRPHCAQARPPRRGSLCWHLRPGPSRRPTPVCQRRRFRLLAWLQLPAGQTVRPARQPWAQRHALLLPWALMQTHARPLRCALAARRSAQPALPQSRRAARPRRPLAQPPPRRGHRPLRCPALPKRSRFTPRAQ